MSAASSASTAPPSTARSRACSPTRRTSAPATRSTPPPSACTARGTSRSRSSTPTSSRPASRGGTRRSRPSRATCAGLGAGRRRRVAPRRSPTARRRSALALEEELRRRALVDELLDRLPGDPTRLSSLPELDEESFDLLLDAIGQALTGGTVGYSDDGTLQLTVFDMGEDRPIAAIRVGDGGVLESPDLLVQVGPA